MRFHELPTPVYVIDEARLKANLERLNALERRTGCRVLLAQKAFSAFALYPLIGRYISGTAASGLYEARLGFEEMGKENHVYSPAYTAAEIDALRTLCSHIIFNSIRQFETFYPRLSGVSAGLRINPQHSTQSGAIYDPCAPYSRLGITRAHFPDALPAGVEGFHMHTLCEQDADALVETFEVLERDFGRYFRALKWLNLGGGHHITRPGYDIDALEGLIGYIRSEYGLTVYLEPGEAVALNAGFLVTEVLDVVENGKPVLKKGKMQPVKGASDSEIIPLGEDRDAYMQKNVLPYNPLAYVDPAKDKIGYEIPFTRLFYKFVAPESSAAIFEDIKALEAKENVLMKELFGNA